MQHDELVRQYLLQIIYQTSIAENGGSLNYMTIATMRLYKTVEPNERERSVQLLLSCFAT